MATLQESGQWLGTNASGQQQYFSNEVDASAFESGTGGTGKDSMQTMFESAGIPWGDVSPQQQFRQFATQQFRPGGYNPMREAFWGYSNPLMQQYYLAAPSMQQPGGSFTDFMSQYGTQGYNPYATPTFPERDLRGLAQRAADISNLTQGQFLQYVDPQEGYAGPAITPEAETRIGTLSPAQQLMYRQTYGTGEAAEENRRQLANTMALQRSGGGMYGGVMGQAIQGAMNELYSQLVAQQPGANFLDWYLGRDKGLGGLTGAAATQV